MEYSLGPVAKRLSQLLDMDVVLAPDCVGEETRSLVNSLQDGGVLLLENLRFHAAEQKNDAEFARALAGLCDVYINDAFGVSHRANASVEAVTSFASTVAAGLLLKKELDFFDTAMQNPVRPLVAIVGGAKVSSKLAALNNMLQHVDQIILGGAMANTFIMAAGFNVGRSMFEADLVPTARALIDQAKKRNIQFYLPVDVVAANQLDPQADLKKVPIQAIPSQWLAADIGPATACLYSEVVRDAGTVIWNGPMGVFEMEPFSHGTYELARAVAASKTVSIVGGGETGSAVNKAGVADQMTYISTGGGAFLTLMEGKQLVAVAALNRKSAPSKHS
jgi:phosphoglycerate kinase